MANYLTLKYQYLTKVDIISKGHCNFVPGITCRLNPRCSGAYASASQIFAISTQLNFCNENVANNYLMINKYSDEMYAYV